MQNPIVGKCWQSTQKVLSPVFPRLINGSHECSFFGWGGIKDKNELQFIGTIKCFTYAIHLVLIITMVNSNLCILQNLSLRRMISPDQQLLNSSTMILSSRTLWIQRSYSSSGSVNRT